MASPVLLGVSTSFDGPTLADAGYFPPDTDAAAGTSQVLVVLNGRIKVYAKNGSAGALDATLNTFFASVLSAGADSVDPRVVFDTTTKRWFVSAIDVPASLASNRVMLAVSDSDTITSGTVWTFFQFQHDTIGGAGDSGDFADFPTLGVDLNAVYIGNSIYTPAGDFVNTSIFVIKKASVLGAGPIVVTPFRDLIPDVDGGSNGMLTAQGATNGDVAATAGYIVGTDWGEFSTLNVRRVTNPGSNTPTLSADMPVAVNKTFYPGSEQGDGIRVVGSTNKLDGGDDRLSAAMIQNGKLYTASDRHRRLDGDCCRFQQPAQHVPDADGCPVVRAIEPLEHTRRGAAGHDLRLDDQRQSEIVLDAVHRRLATGSRRDRDVERRRRCPPERRRFVDAFRPELVHVARGLHCVGCQLQRRSAGSLLRWGDYSMTTVDPCDGQTFWTIQEYVPSVDNWGVKVAKVMAPGPATPSTLSPAAIATGQASVDVTVTRNIGERFRLLGHGGGQLPDRGRRQRWSDRQQRDLHRCDPHHAQRLDSRCRYRHGARSHDHESRRADDDQGCRADGGRPSREHGLADNLRHPAFQNGTVLTADRGTWSGFPASTFAYQWERCNAAGNACGDISAATASTYTLAAPADTAQTIRVRVDGVERRRPRTATAESACELAQIAGPPGEHRPCPTISGTTAVGDTLTAANGTWSGYPAPTFAYQWRACDSVGANCSDLGRRDRLHARGRDRGCRVTRSASSSPRRTAPDRAPRRRHPSAFPAPPSNLTPPSIIGHDRRQARR